MFRIGTFAAPVDINSTLDVSGISTFNGNIDINADLDVDGHTNLDNVSISGFTTITQDLDVDGHTNLIMLIFWCCNRNYI